MIGTIVELVGMLVALPLMALLWVANHLKYRSYHQKRFRGFSYNGGNTFDIE